MFKFGVAMINKLTEKAINRENLTRREFEFIVNYPDMEKLCKAACRIKEHFFNSNIEFCSIINAKSGRCSEDCKFCAQSAHYKTDVSEYDFVDLEKIEEQAKELKKQKVKRFSIVTSGKSPAQKDLEKIEKAVEVIRKSGLLADISIGVLDKNTLIELKKTGVSGFHHNLEVSRSFFENICTTHSYDEDIKSVQNAVELGFFVCSGGIFGVGESWQHRIELAVTLKELNVHSIPLNFLNPIKGTPLGNMAVLKEDEALKIIALYRFILPDKQIRICGGRNRVFDSLTKRKILNCGASAIMVGNYLTTPGFNIQSDIEDTRNLNLKII